MKIKRLSIFFLIMLMMFSVLTGCSNNSKSENAAPNNNEVTPADNNSVTPTAEIQNKNLILSTTTSTQDSGLLDYLMPIFTQDTGIDVKVVAVGTGKALQMGVDGEADVLLVHAKSKEEEFVKNGDGLERFDVMYNDFVLVGPKGDPNNVGKDNPNDVKKAFSNIASNSVKFISRGDNSGTNTKELGIWKAAGIEPQGDWYISAGKGMGDVLQMASEMQAYTLTDRATYLSMRDKLDLDITVEGDNDMFNQYGVIAVNPNKNDKINAEGAQAFIDWILSDKVQSLIGDFGKDKYGQGLFVPNAK